MDDLFFVGVFLILIGIVIYAVYKESSKGVKVAKEKYSKREMLKDNLVKKNGILTKVIDGESNEEETIFVFEQTQIIVIKGSEYKFDSILDFSINGGQSYKITTSTGSALGRGIVGGVLLGGVGALAGAGTATKKANPNGKDYLICITTKDLANPMIEYRTKSDTRANELVSVLKIILDRTNSEHK